MDLPQSYLHYVTFVLAVLNHPVLLPELTMAVSTTMINLNFQYHKLVQEGTSGLTEEKPCFLSRS
jgi:hypothetical protein